MSATPSSPARVAILGSCVSRRAFGHNDGREAWRLPRPVVYASRSSLVSLMSPPLEPIEAALALASNEHEREWMRMDFDRSFWHEMQRADPDFLLLDLIDDRTDLYWREGACKTKVWDLQNADPLFRGHGFKLLQRYTPSCEKVWRDAATRFVRRIQAEFPRVRLILHSARLLDTFSDGSLLHQGTDWWAANPAIIVRLNTMLAGYESHLQALVPGLIMLRADPAAQLLQRNHVWGEAPFHYCDAYDESVAQELGKITAGQV